MFCKTRIKCVLAISLTAFVFYLHASMDVIDSSVYPNVRITSNNVGGPLLNAPFRLLVAGCSGAGKSTFVQELIEKNIFTENFREIKYFHSEEKPDIKHSKIIFSKTLPTVEEMGGAYHKLYIFDDLIRQVGESTTLLDLFTKYSRHRLISVMLLTQNLFYKGKHIRTISLNADYITIFKNPRDGSQISFLSKQVMPSEPKTLTDIYTEITKDKPHSYIFLDLKQQTPDRLRIWTDITTQTPLVLAKN